VALAGSQATHSCLLGVAVAAECMFNGLGCCAFTLKISSNNRLLLPLLPLFLPVLLPLLLCTSAVDYGG